MVIQEVIKRASIEKDWLDEVYMGCAIDGGAIAIGNPLRASGTWLVLTLLYELRRRERYQIASI
jgi:acetyl-CoA acetyltransferase